MVLDLLPAFTEMPAPVTATILCLPWKERRSEESSSSELEFVKYAMLGDSCSDEGILDNGELVNERQLEG